MNVSVILFLFPSPYIIGTSNQPVKMTANHGLHLSFRLVKEMAVGVFSSSDYTVVRFEAHCGVNKSIKTS